MLDNDKTDRVMRLLSKYFVSLFGIGYVPIAPGTLGSAFAILVWYISITYFNIYYFYFLLILVFLIANQLIKHYIKIKKKDDPSEVIIDEFIGQSIPLVFIFEFNIYEILLAFSAFRFFDILKIYPVNKAENLKGATGIIMDDVVAGIYALIIIMIYKIILFINA